MKVFAISDFHLSLTADKPMNIFGPVWDNYLETIEKDWNKKVSDEDIVLIAGDISWAMRFSEAKEDLKYLMKLKGNKVFIKGNHDYWWNSISALREILDSKTFALQNDALKIGNFVICGSRGWTAKENGKFKSADDEKIYKRELIRMELSLKNGKALMEEGDKLIVMQHFPPMNNKCEKNEFTELDSLLTFLTTTLTQTEDIFASQNDENSVFVQLGSELDKFIASGKSKLITKEDIYTLLPFGIDYAKETLIDGMDSEYFVEALSGISTNIKNIELLEQSINFESEFKYIEKIYKNLGNIDMEDLATTCETLGKLFDEIANTPNHSNLITNNEFVVLVSGILKDFAKDQSNDGIGTAIANLLFSITGKDADNSTTPPTPATTGTLSSNLAGSVLGIFNNENTIITNTIF